MTTWRTDPRTRQVFRKRGARRVLVEVTRYFVTCTGRAGRYYESRAQARTVVDALNGRCYEGGWATREAFEIRALANTGHWRTHRRAR